MIFLGSDFGFWGALIFLLANIPSSKISKQNAGGIQPNLTSLKVCLKYDVIRVRVVRKSGFWPRKKLKFFDIDFKANKKFSGRLKPNSLFGLAYLNSSAAIDIGASLTSLMHPWKEP